jgi:hypothetical protein
MTTLPRIRRLTLALTIALSLGALVTALIGPAETLAQTHKTACSSSGHTKKAKSTTHPCPTHKSEVKSKVKSRSTTKAKHAKKRHKRAAPLPRIPASCEDGSAPVLSEGSFHCSDGSEPQCVDGATPAASHNGKMLLCPAVAGGEGSSAEAECEEEELECVASSSPDEEACEAAANGSIACEGEGEAES